MSSATDPEVVAMTALAEALAELDREQARRVLDWARGRYIDVHIEEVDLDFFRRFVEGAREAADELGDIAPIDVVRALARAKEEAA